MESKNNLIYFNNNKTTLLDKTVEEAMQVFQNTDGKTRGDLLNKAKEQIAQLLNCQSDELLFTRGTSESIVLALSSVFKTCQTEHPHFICSAGEHPAVLNTLKHLAELGAEISYLAINREGLIDLDELKSQIRSTTRLVCIMAANNETGVIQPIEEIAHVCHQNGLLFFSDASQYVGKMRSDLEELGIDVLAFGAHKMYGPPGIGVLYIRKQHTTLLKYLRETYTNTPDPILLVGFGKAAELCDTNYWDHNTHISKIKNYLEHQLLEIEGLRINGTTKYRLYNTSNLTFPAKYNITAFLSEFDFAHNKDKESHVLKAMGISSEDIKNSYRFSFGKDNHLEEVKLLIEKIRSI